MCNVLINEELYDEEFVKKWTIGFPEFSQYVTHFTPEVVEHITGISAETVVSLAKRIAQTHGVAPVMYSGLEYSDGAVQAIRAVFTFWALAGQLAGCSRGMVLQDAKKHVPNQPRRAYSQPRYQKSSRLQ
jgi:anaerobic selenocysteine-containing dehydrogenase